MESGAILLWLAEKTGRFMPEGKPLGSRRMADVADGRFRPDAWPGTPFPEVQPRQGGLCRGALRDRGAAALQGTRYQASGRDFVAGDYSIADMAIWPWASRFEWQHVDLADYPNVRDWYLRIADRPAVQKGYQQPKDMGPIPRSLTGKFHAFRPEFVPFRV